jgi:hypothetical protein
MAKKPTELSLTDLLVNQAQAQFGRVIYCKKCGRQILHCSNDELTAWVKDWELNNELHWSCKDDVIRDLHK